MSVFTRDNAEDVIRWYEQNKRDLPWRDTGDPYDVWISEIMLQQTRIEAVREKYLRFMAELPDIRSLAECPEDKLMRLWEGLGYYNRARNLRKCAEYLCEHENGVLPADYKRLLGLPGIGTYTAGAIASIAYHLPCPAIDGNVLRVLARYYGIREDIRQEKTINQIRDLLLPVYEEELPYSSLNQGLMEIGEVLCLPKGMPKCEQCPLRSSCTACREQTTGEIPYRSSLKKRKILERTILVIRNGDHFLLKKRPDTGLLAGLYEFPGIDKHCGKKEIIARVESMNYHVMKIHPLPDAVHVFSHLEWKMKAYEVWIEEPEHTLSSPWISADLHELQDLALPSAFRAYIDWYSLRK
ncbi:MAG: A/G-specific adenine glycosylase [Solobacterium sp.]|nr:A/G-specific adenine glycosylase [Solobacterium sp.]